MAENRDSEVRNAPRRWSRSQRITGLLVLVALVATALILLARYAAVRLIFSGA